MSPEDLAPGEVYQDLHATVVDAIRYVGASQPLEDAADEVLTRLREAGLPVPAKP